MYMPAAIRSNWRACRPPMRLPNSTTCGLDLGDSELGQHGAGHVGGDAGGIAVLVDESERDLVGDADRDRASVLELGECPVAISCCAVVAVVAVVGIAVVVVVAARGGEHRQRRQQREQSHDPGAGHAGSGTVHGENPPSSGCLPPGGQIPARHQQFARDAHKDE
jgi:hypothetical protein